MVVSQKMLTVLTSSLVQERNVSPLMLNVSGKILKMFIWGLKHAVNGQITEDYEYYFEKKQLIEQWISSTEKYTAKASDQIFIA